ncbi:hypothetical protein AJ79_00205 [Helicocarpus griseus UAMH5409]|uniref:Major facilitator superfamily (MFS) profile domain-containing protein n=1 Tax=Helicocarpus griseus UAMH5409 TaxID=1447875 RepID=A0A2B7YD46_9EURO|nr:hypothetical protein AJ79_00205 [Helicocarpus griseus UAMH5409]
MSNDGSKGQAQEVEQASSRDEEDFMTAEMKKRCRKIYLKVDFRMIPILGAIYAISGIDRTNLSAARVAGMHEDLRFDIGERYSIVLLVFFITYFIFEIPSNVILRKVGAARWLSFIALSWGVVILGAGFVKSWAPMIAIRLLLGLFEAGFFPGCMYLISCWYQRYQVQQRIAWFYSLNVIANGFGSLLAYGLIRMEGLGGLRGWRWIFIIEGLITCVLAIMGYFLIIDFPDKLAGFKRPFLSLEDVEIIKARLNRDRSDAEHDLFSIKKVFQTLCRWQLWIYSLLFMCTAVGIYGYAYFTVVILQGMGYSTGRVFLLSAPPAIVSVPVSLIVSYVADKTRLRAPFIAFMAIMCLVGYVLVTYAKQNGVKYFGIFLGIAGANGALPAILAWQANNIRGQSTRAVASGLQVAFGAVGGVYASLTFMEKEAPTYFTGLWAGIAAMLFMVVACAFMSVFHYVQNKRAARGEILIEGLEGFRYTY